MPLPVWETLLISGRPRHSPRILNCRLRSIVAQEVCEETSVKMKTECPRCGKFGEVFWDKPGKPDVLVGDALGFQGGPRPRVRRNWESWWVLKRRSPRDVPWGLENQT